MPWSQSIRISKGNTPDAPPDARPGAPAPRSSATTASRDRGAEATSDAREESLVSESTDARSLTQRNRTLISLASRTTLEGLAPSPARALASLAAAVAQAAHADPTATTALTLMAVQPPEVAAEPFA